MKLFSLSTLGAAQCDVTVESLPPSKATIPLPPFADKDEYRKWCVDPNTQHSFVSFLEGQIPGQRVSKVNNPAMWCHGLIAEFDAPVKGMDAENVPFPPMWACQSFSGHARAFWGFAQPVNVEHKKLAAEFFKIAFLELKAKKLAAGFELEESCEEGKYFEVGRDWQAAGGHTIPNNIIEGWLFRAAQKVDWSKEAPKVPFDKIRKELERKFPGKWPGGWESFQVGSRGTRFWAGGDAMSVYVTEAGLFCHSGQGEHSPFVPWATLVGVDWMRQAQDDLIGATVKDIYFYSATGQYYRETPSGGWSKFQKGDLNIFLRKCGLTERQGKGETVSQVEDALLYTHNYKNVAFAGPVAGRRAGLRKVLGRPILVTESPTVITPATSATPFPVIQEWMDNLFGWESEQCQCVIGWLKYAYIAIATNTYRPGQALAISGAPKSAKSVFQHEIITPICGNRSADPFRYMAGDSTFNSDLIGAEHMLVEDKSSSTSTADRRKLGSHIKAATVNRHQSAHGKGKDAITLDPIWRLSISFNSESENVCIMPPMDESLADKVILTKVELHPLPMPTHTDEEWEAFRAAVARELPAFVRFLLDFEPADDKRCDRFGVVAFHHPDILAALSEMASETRLWEMIQADPLMTDGNGKPAVWSGSQDALTQHLFKGDNATTARMLLRWPGACGTYLARLGKMYPDKIIKGSDKAGRHIWTIKPI